MVVTPPAAAERVDQTKPSWFFWLSECTCASMAPGRISAVAEIVAVATGGRCALADQRHLAVAHRNEAALDDAVGTHHGPLQHEIEIRHRRPP